MGQHTILDAGIGLGNLTYGQDKAPVVSKPYLKQIVIRLPIVASASAQSISVSSIPFWPASNFQVITSTLNVVVPPTTGTTKTVSAGYTGSNTAFFSAQTAAAAGKFAGAGAVTVNIAGLAAITYTLGSNNWSTDAIVELILTGSALD